MPCVAYREEENRQFRRADGAEALCEVIYALDVWSLSAQEARDLLDEVDAALCAEGFARTQTQSLFEEKTRFYHLCARYRALTDGTNLFQ